MDLLVHIPTRERPSKLRAAIDSFNDYAGGEVRFLLSCDDDDSRMVLRADEFTDPNIRIRWGPRVSKIEAFNRDVEAMPWDILVSASDDMRACAQGWDTRIIEAVKAYGPDVALWCDDGRQKRLCTIPVMDRAYYQRDREIFNPEYRSFYADDEWHEKAQHRGRLERIPGPMFRHDQYQFVHATNDGLYRFNERHKATDKATYIRRRQNGFA